MPALSRRNFIAATAAAAAAAAAGTAIVVGRDDESADPATTPTTSATEPANSVAEPGNSVAEPTAGGVKPNMVVIMVDEMRFPMHFPEGITTPEEFMSVHMPNLHQLWKRGVKFDNHYTAGTACSPSRASFVTGLYPHQQWCLQTRKGDNDGASGVQAPALDPNFPTYGKLLQTAGYRTPWVGKWHLSDFDATSGAGYLADYGYEGLTLPDPIGTNGEGLVVDPDIAGQAVQWLGAQSAAGVDPFCLTVSFVNPHDKEFFWGGTEADRYNQLFADASLDPMVTYDQPNLLDDPARVRYPAVPANWESTEDLINNKPACHLFARSFTDGIWGGASDDPSEANFAIVDNPNPVLSNKVAMAPYAYWKRSSDAYTQVLTLVDIEIGRVIDAIPAELAENTVIVMTADHGDYSSSHGFLSNKVGTMYEEAVKVPLIVADPRGRFTGDGGVPRTQLTSSVDVLPLLVSLGNNGSRAWLDETASADGFDPRLVPARGMPTYDQIYGNRFDMLPLLKSNGASGRAAVLMASDEWVPEYFVYNNASRHILGLRTADMKVASYSNWNLIGIPDYDTAELESYDYATERGRLELDNGRAASPQAQALIAELHGQYDTTEMSAFLPLPYRHLQDRAKVLYLAYIALLDATTPDGGIDPPDLTALRALAAEADVDIDLSPEQVQTVLAAMAGKNVRDLIHLG
jgi:arylsulfatase A-like enzyme